MENKTYKYAGFWIRALAIFLDWVALMIIGAIFFGKEVTKMGATETGFEIGFNYEGWSALIPLLYAPVFWIWKSATPGKLICGLKIIETDGKKLSPLKSIIRFFSYIPSFIFFLGFFWAGFDKHKQAWHDKIAKTYVIHYRKSNKPQSSSSA